MAPTNRHSTRSRSPRQRHVVEVVQHGRQRLLTSEGWSQPTRRPAKAKAAPTREEQSTDDIDFDLSDDDTFDDETQFDPEPVPFEPDPQDDADFRWFFGLGEKDSPKWLRPREQRRFERIYRRLDRGGRTLCLQYNNPRNVERAFAPAVYEPTLFWWNYPGEDPQLESIEDCQLFVQRVLDRRSSPPARNAADPYIVQLHAREDQRFTRVRHEVVTRLGFEYARYLERKNAPLTPSTVFPRAHVLAYLGPTAFAYQRREGHLWVSTWGDVVIPHRFVRSMVARSQPPGAPVQQQDEASNIKMLRAAMKAAYDHQRASIAADRRDRGTRRDRWDELKKAANDDNYGTLQRLARRERGQFLKEQRKYENDPSLVETNPHRLTTTVSKIAAEVGLPVKLTRELLISENCTWAKVDRQPIPTGWLALEAGEAFWKKAEAARAALQRSRDAERGTTRPPTRYARKR